ncbi:MAG: omega-3 polyunsaturated fatty acid synthase subunit, PfaA, partial [Paenibacillus sp.]|nr:omega-3 polyunsaturated fatty acid synthase subunit, PfaA [Paenibacillus sp.]
SLALWQALAQLSVWGIPLELASLWEGFRTMKEPPTDPKPSFTVKISGVNYGKPYPAREETTNTKERQVINVETRNYQQHQQHRQHLPNKHQSDQHQPDQQAITNTQYANEAPMSSAAFLQSQMTEAHLAFQKALTESHHAYLRSTEKIVAAMTGQQQLANETYYVPSPYDDAKQKTTQRSAYIPPAKSAAMIEYEAPTVQPTETRAIPVSNVHNPVVPVISAIQAPANPAIPAAVPAAPSNGNDVKTIMLEVVSDKTGYPQQMVDMDLDLESGLGIDSIKRVEILSAAQEMISGLPEFDPSDLTGLRTLNEIVDYMEQMLKKNGTIG